MILSNGEFILPENFSQPLRTKRMPSIMPTLLTDNERTIRIDLGDCNPS
jgi:hypothetical protein